ncbi:FAD-dependent oxidoreductase [Candidatus Bathyarchaeota archaeon]|nr:FAD-dependent oxidoreductase [Candidatus Bathyarchaeota archaeon]MBS7630152.1 FAD-dependent oxidoreductase [Candidatus Bathyarchaeota archaeon]
MILKKVIVVGAGPAGIFAAYELADKFQVIVLEAEDYVGGAGLHSDGKLNYNPFIGGNLTEFVTEDQAWSLIFKIREVFRELGVESSFHEEEQKRLEAHAVKSGLKFVKIIQSHIGSDHLPRVMEGLKEKLERKGVEIHLNTKATRILVEDDKAFSVQTNQGEFEADFFILAPGRAASNWLIEEMRRTGNGMSFNPIDIGVRIEVLNEVMEEITYKFKCWDPKFHIYTPSYDDFVRTFCTCPRGFVVREAYGEGLFGVNGHSMRDTGSPNVNFALLTKISLTEPLENTTEYGRRIAQLSNTIGGGKPILQRLGDLRAHRRSTWERIKRSYVEPTLRDVTPGDISMAYPSRIVKNVLESLEILDRVIPGVNSESTLIYAPEIKFYAMHIQTDNHLRTRISNLYVAGDGAGISRGIVGAAATGIIAARGIISQELV